jgi:Lon protease-like protein
MQHPFSHLSQLPTIPSELPLMVLGECYHLPGTVLPLFIFEQRYRNMLEYALSTSRMFCVANRLDTDDDSDTPQLFRYATAAMVQASVKQSDGTSQLMLLGIRRVKFKTCRIEQGFRIAELDPLTSVIEDEVKVKAQEAEALKLLANLEGADAMAIQALLAMLYEAESPELTCDVLTYHFVRKPALLRRALKETIVENRFETLLQELSEMKGLNLGKGR